MKRNTFGALSPAKQEIVRRMQLIGFGKICDLPVVEGEPVLEQARIVRRQKLSRRPEPPAYDRDFELKMEHVLFFETLQDMHDGEIACLEVQHGLPCLVDIIEKV